MLIFPVLLIALTGCWPFTQNSSPSSIPTPLPTLQTAPSQIGTLSPAIDTIAQQVLTNIHLHGWNPNAVTHGKVTGGLYTNWVMNDPAITNNLGVKPPRDFAMCDGIGIP